MSYLKVVKDGLPDHYILNVVEFKQEGTGLWVHSFGGKFETYSIPEDSTVYLCGAEGKTMERIQF